MPYNKAGSCLLHYIPSYFFQKRDVFTLFALEIHGNLMFSLAYEGLIMAEIEFLLLMVSFW